MAKACQKGVSPLEFRKCLNSDIEFIIDFGNAMAEKQEQKAHEQKIKEAMNSLPMR